MDRMAAHRLCHRMYLHASENRIPLLIPKVRQQVLNIADKHFNLGRDNPTEAELEWLYRVECSLCVE